MAATQNPKNLVCQTMQQVNEMINLPLALQATVEFALKELELPLSREDVEDFFEARTEINLFSVDVQDNRRNISRSPNLTGPTFTVQSPMLVTAVCAYGYSEPASMLIEGNQFGTQAQVEALAITPASPINLRNQVDAINALIGVAAGQQAAGVGVCPAHLEVGGPTWNFVWAYLSAYRLMMMCPHSAFEQIMRERLVDIGNCCSLVDFSGFGSSEASHLYWTRRVNARLHDLQNADLAGLPAIAGTTQGADPGYFVPVNCEQNSDFQITPNRTTGVLRGYGKPQASGDLNKWAVLPYPVALDENTKIKLVLERDGDGDAQSLYFNRMLEEGCVKDCLPPIPNAAHANFPIAEADKAPSGTGGIASFTQIPAGMLRIGLGLKGIYLRQDLCTQWKKEMNGTDAVTRAMAGDIGGLCGRPRPEEDIAGHVGEG